MEESNHFDLEAYVFALDDAIDARNVEGFGGADNLAARMRASNSGAKNDLRKRFRRSVAEPIHNLLDAAFCSSLPLGTLREWTRSP